MGCIGSSKIADPTSLELEVHSSQMQHILLYHPTFEALAKAVAAHAAAKGKVQLSEIQWKSFADGFPNVKLLDPAVLDRSASVTILINFADPAIIFEQLSVVYALPRMGSRNFRVILPFFSVGTMERVDSFGEIATAMTMARLLSSTPLCATGPSTVTIYDIHALQEQFYFGDAVHAQLQSALDLLTTRIAQLPDKDDVAIVFPDDGAAKRFKSALKAYPHVVCLKVRGEGDARNVVVKEGESKGKHCIIVDDLVQSGGTLAESAKAVLAAGATRVSCFVTHGVFPKESWKKFVDGAHKGVFDHFWITDSIPHSAESVRDTRPFEVLSLAPLVAGLLTGE